jgi:hypothetical protein
MRIKCLCEHYSYGSGQGPKTTFCGNNIKTSSFIKGMELLELMNVYWILKKHFSALSLVVEKVLSLGSFLKKNI